MADDDPRASSLWEASTSTSINRRKIDSSSLVCEVCHLGEENRMRMYDRPSLLVLVLWPMVQGKDDKDDTRRRRGHGEATSPGYSMAGVSAVLSICHTYVPVHAWCQAEEHTNLHLGPGH
ncbi:uncharacterized protein [Triticum aestivum]|uniref:uncharacterized protein n=1 Tax=Triticum aestivum TaxID=4565 RepID=UPI001D027BE2|nr:uncharacterized protein LOC123133675 [Triticum aestivum]